MQGRRYHRRVNIATHPVVASLTPVFLLIALGYLAGRLQWIREAAVKDLSNLVFLLLIPALLFRTMSAVHFETLDLRPVAAYFPAALALLGVSIAWRGFNRSSVVMALGGVLRDLVGSLASSGWLGAPLNSPATGYSVVFHLEIYLLFVVLVALGPLVRRRPAAKTSAPPMGLAELPG